MIYNFFTIASVSTLQHTPPTTISLKYAVYISNMDPVMSLTTHTYVDEKVFIVIYISRLYGFTHTYS